MTRQRESTGATGVYTTRTLEALHATLECIWREPAARRPLRAALDEFVGGRDVTLMTKRATRLAAGQVEGEMAVAVLVIGRNLNAIDLEGALSSAARAMTTDRDAARSLGARRVASVLEGLVEQLEWVVRRMRVDRHGSDGP